MRKLYLLLFVLCSGCQTVVQEARLHGSLAGLGLKEVEVYYDGYTSEIYGNRNIEVTPDADGLFDVVVRLVKPEYFKAGQNLIYLTPEDDMEISVVRQATASVFAGVGSEAAEYLKGIRWNDNSKLGLSWGRRLPFDVLLQKTDSLARIRREELAALKDVSDEFRKLETARITADLVNVYFGNIYSTEYYKWDDPAEMKEQKKVEYYKFIFDRIESLLRQIDGDESLLDVASVREVLLECHAAGLGINVTPLLKELAETIAVANDMDLGITQTNADRFTQYSDAIHDKSLRGAFDAKLVSRMRLMEGRPAIDIELRDVEGNVSKLSDHRGEILYIDFWATWCLPCLAQSPHFKELSEKYPQVRFIGVSIDMDESKWLAKMQSENHDTVMEYIADPFDVKDKWDLATIPRFLLIDRDFNIISAFAPQPSNSEEIRALLEAHISIANNSPEYKSIAESD